MDIDLAKAIALVILLIIPVAFGSLSVYLITKYRTKLLFSKRGRGFLSHLNYFAGGVFLGTCLLLVLHQGKDTFEEYKRSINVTTTFPFFEVGIGVGFFLVALTEKLTQFLFARGYETDQDSPDVGTCRTHGTLPMLIESDLHLYEDMEGCDAASTQNILKGYGTIQSPATDLAETQNQNKNSTQGGVKPQTEASDESAQSSYTEETRSFCSFPKSQKHDGDRKRDKEHATSRARQEVIGNDGKGKSECSDLSNFSHLRVLVLVLALSFHTVFDGLTVGVQTDERTVFSLLAVIIIHKIIMATVLGVELATTLKGQKTSRAFLMLLLFALTTPVGVAIGICVTSGHVNRHAQMLTGSVLMSLSTGAFLYVTCFESLQTGMGSGARGSVLPVLLAITGFLLIAAVEVCSA